MKRECSKIFYKSLLALVLILFQAIALDADKNWIPIESMDKAQTVKPTKKLDVDLSQIEPLNKMIKSATVIKQLIDVTTKKETPTGDDKSWFVLHSEHSK